MKSRITSVSYKQNRNLGNFESSAIEATAIVDESDNPEEVLQNIKQFVLDNLYPENKVQQDDDNKQVAF